MSPEQSPEPVEGPRPEPVEGMRPKELVKLAKAEGFSRTMFYRARDELGSSIENTVARHHPNNTWRWVGP